MKMKMKRWALVLFVLSLIEKHGIFQHIEAADDGFVKTKGARFMLNGSPFYANGFNAYWLMYEGTDPAERAKVTSAYQQATKHGLKIARTWAFNDGGYRALQTSPGVYDEKTFQGLDFAISEAKKFNIKLVLSLVNNYDNYGGRKQYVEWAKNKGVSVSTEDDFYTNSEVKGYYKNHVKTVLTRRNTLTGIAYKDDPTIMAWELMNEPRCAADPSGKTVHTWITEMASYLKSIDGKHLLQIGLEGFYGESNKKPEYASFKEGTDFIANNQIPGIDFATVHSYPDQWLPGKSDEEQLAFIKTWYNDHIQDAKNVLHKPVLFAEYGKSLKLSSATARDQLYRTIYSIVYSSASHGGAAAGNLFWHLLAEGMDNFNDGYEIVLSQNPEISGLIAQESQKLNRIRKMYVRLTNIERWKRAREKKAGGH